MKHVLEAAEPLSPAARASLAEMEQIFEAAARRAQKDEPAPTARKAVRAATAKLEPSVPARPAARKKEAAPVRVRKPATAKAKPE
jgi:hypothetical protein